MRVLKQHEGTRLVFDPARPLHRQHAVEQSLGGRWVQVFSCKLHAMALLGFERCAGLRDDYYEPGRWRLLYRGGAPS